MLSRILISIELFEKILGLFGFLIGESLGDTNEF